MEIILVCITAILLVYTFSQQRYRNSLLTLFILLWFSIFLLYSFRLYNLYDCSETTFLIYLLGILSFFLGYKQSGKYRVKTKNNGVKKENKIKKYIFIFLSIISFVILLKKSILAIPFWLVGGSGLKEAIINENVLALSPIEEIIYSYIARPMQIVLVIYATIELSIGIKNKFIIPLAIALTLAGYLSSGSKFSVFEIPIVILSFQYFFGQNNLLKYFKKHKILMLLVLGICVFIFHMLGQKDGSAFKSLYMYLCGCMPCSDNALDVICKTDPYYGLVSFNGIFRVLNLIPSLLGIGTEFKMTIDNTFLEFMEFEKTVYIGPDVPYNAFISMFSYFYADGRYFGVLLLSFIFGFFCCRIFNSAKTNPSKFSYALVLLCFIMIYLSMVRFQLFLVHYVMSFVYIYVFFPKETLCRKRN